MLCITNNRKFKKYIPSNGNIAPPIICQTSFTAACAKTPYSRADNSCGRENSDFEIRFYECGYRDILIIARDMVHKGHKLLTHPLAGSIKPNETPVKTIILTAEQAALDLESLSLIEAAIMTFEKFTKRFKEDDLDDFEKIDFETIDFELFNIKEV